MVCSLDTVNSLGFLPWNILDGTEVVAQPRLSFAHLKSHERLLDPCGGAGTIAMEAATCFPDIYAVSSAS